AYDRYAAKEASVVLAQCWAHTRRNFIEASSDEPALCNVALDFIGKLYENEEHIRRKMLQGEDKLCFRSEKSKPVVDAFFVWLKETFHKILLLNSSPFTKAASYAIERQGGLSVFLADPNVQIDTNHL